MMNVEAGEGSGIFVFSSQSFFNWGSWIGSVLSLQISVFWRFFLSESSFLWILTWRFFVVLFFVTSGQFAHTCSISICFDLMTLQEKNGSVVMTTFTVLLAKCWSMFGRDLRVRVSWVHIGSDHLTQSGTPMASLRHPQHPCLEYCQPRDWGRNSAQLGLATEVGPGMGWWSQRLDRWFSCVAHLLKRYSMLKL